MKFAITYLGACFALMVLRGQAESAFIISVLNWAIGVVTVLAAFALWHRWQDDYTDVDAMPTSHECGYRDAMHNVLEVTLRQAEKAKQAEDPEGAETLARLAGAIAEVEQERRKNVRYDPRGGQPIIRAREELLTIATDLGKMGLTGQARHIRDIVGELMHRKSSGKPTARVKSEKLTPALVVQILRHCARNPEESRDDTGARFGVNGGRVSEICLEQRTPAYPDGTPEWKGKKK